jgi:RNA polymerase sigma-70 factor (ECF subfamily)
MNSMDEAIPTRQSLLGRLKDWNDQESWQVFFDTYWRLIYNAAMRAGLDDAEAQDVVQETILSVSKKLPGFEYDPAKGSFKGWLLTMTRWRITDQLRRRTPETGQPGPERLSPTSTAQTATIERLPDPAGSVLDALWDEEWEGNLLAAAVERVKKKVAPREYQVFDFYVSQKLPVSQVARALRVNRGQVYLAKHRINRLIKKEIAYLRNKLI